MEDASAEGMEPLTGRGSAASETPLPPAQSAIVAAARDLFAAYGYAKTNVGDIARRVGMSPANLYRHFRNKRAIGQAVVDAYVAEEAQVVAQALADAGPSAEARLRAHITAATMFTIQHLRQTPALVELAEMVFDDEDGRCFIEAYLVQELATLSAIIADGVARGEFAPPVGAEAAARATHLAVRYFQAPHAIARHGVDQVETDLALCLDLVCAGLRGPAPTQGAAQ